MSNSKLDDLKQHGDQVLLAEVGALLHDLGKLSSQFVDQMSVSPSATTEGFEHENAVEKINEFVDAQFLNALKSTKLRNRLRTDKIPNNEQIGQVLDLILHHDKSKHSAFLVRLLNRCDGADSGADKGTTRQAGLPKETKQPFAKTYNATAFGNETLEFRIKQNKLDSSRQNLSRQLGQALDGFLSDPQQMRFRILQLSEVVYRSALGETRRSANDVTLWEHSFSVATLYKSAVANLLLTSALDEKSLRWRMLRVNFDVLSLYAKAIKIADLLGYQERIDQACAAIKQLIEEEYPLGNEVYRDTTGIYFTFPDIDLPAELAQEIRCRVEEIEMELAPRIAVGTGQGNTAAEQLKQILADQRNSAQKELAQLFSSEVLGPCWKEQWDNLHGGKWEVCPVCRLRPMKEHGEACEYCFTRRGSRVEEWMENPTKTIWMDEIADQNDRVALLVGKFGLDDWLSGDLVQTMLVKAEKNDPLKCVRKNPSPARLRRIWETCQQFWDDSIISIFQELLPDCPRWELVPQMQLKPNEPPKETVCDGTLNGQSISVFRIGDRLLTISFVEKTKEGTLSISWEKYGRKKMVKIDIVEVRKAEGELSKYRCYAHFLPLLSSPDQFLALVPANDALAITEKIRKDYIEQFSKVQNRLPLFLGLVFFQRKMPLMAVMDTARRMLAVSQGKVQANISDNLNKVNIDADGWPKEVRVPIQIKNDPEAKVFLQIKDKSFEIVMETVMGDGQTHDVWYPYWRVEGRPTNRERYFIGFDKEHWVHINDLKKNDEVQFYPSSFAYLFLENTAQRFAFDPHEDVMLLDELPRLRKIVG